jgi:hypothetical protein
MASFNIHLAIAKRYAKKNGVENLKAFYSGTIDPDLVEDKNVSHYTGTRNKDDLLTYLQLKVQLPQFLSESAIDNDYEKGIFLHLITDYLFYNDFFDRNYLEKVTYNDFIKDLYYSYDNSNKYLTDKYKLDINEIKDKVNNNIKKNQKEKNVDLCKDNNLKNLLQPSKLDDFIERVSNINLKKYRERLLSSKKNILP